MRIKVVLLNDSKHPAEIKASEGSRTLWIEDAENIYAKLLKVLNNEIREVLAKAEEKKLEKNKPLRKQLIEY